MGINLIWFLLIWPMWILSTDPQSSPTSRAPPDQEFISVHNNTAKVFPSIHVDHDDSKQKSTEIPLAPPTIGNEQNTNQVNENFQPQLSESGKFEPETIPSGPGSGSGDSVHFVDNVSDGDLKTEQENPEVESSSYQLPDSEVESQIPATPSHDDQNVPFELPNDTVLQEQSPEDITPVHEAKPDFVASKGSEPAEEEENKTMTVEKTEEIPSFSEWTKLQLSKKKDSSLLPPNGVARENKKEDGKNFASPDCGAKILLANPEAGNPNGIMSSSHDEYMLNKCGVSSWIIIELCEPIRIEKVSIGNLELFSSCPKEVDVGVSDRYPTRDWVKIGPLELPDSRAVHSFHVNGNSSSYSKYVKIQILSHHGNEHYCPVSVIRIYGKSEYEVFDAAHSDEDGNVDAGDQSSLSEESMNNEGANENSLIGTAAEAVIKMVKKAAQVFVKKGSASGSNDTASCQSVSSCLPSQNVRANITEICNYKLLYFIQANSNRLTNSVSCNHILSAHSIGAPHQVEGFWRALFGDGILNNVCSYISPLRNCILNESKKVEENGNGIKGNTSQNANNVSEQKQTPLVAPQQPVENSQPSPDASATAEKIPVVVIEEESRVQKESVFVRLTNRIKALERNQSLSSGYLEELSQRFKKQSEESHSISQNLKRSFNETLSKYKWIQEFSQRESRYLRRNVEDLRITLWRTEMQRGFLIFFALVQFIGIGLFCCWTRRKISNLQDRIQSIAQPKLQLNVSNSKYMDTKLKQESHATILPRKRSNSHPDVMKLKKKKKKKEILKHSENSVFNFVSPLAPEAAKLSTPTVVSNNILTSSNQNQIQPPSCPSRIVHYDANSDTCTANRFGLLASPSVHTLSSSVGSTSSFEGISKNVETNGHGQTPCNGSGGSLDSGGSVSVGKLKGKKMKFKNFIPKLFEKEK